MSSQEGVLVQGWTTQLSRECTKQVVCLPKNITIRAVVHTLPAGGIQWSLVSKTKGESTNKTINYNIAKITIMYVIHDWHFNVTFRKEKH
jgi:hypothetical protein